MTARKAESSGQLPIYSKPDPRSGLGWSPTIGIEVTVPIMTNLSVIEPGTGQGISGASAAHRVRAFRCDYFVQKR